MNLTLSRRFRFCCSRSLLPFAGSVEEAVRLYGISKESIFGHGLNPQVDLVFSGPVDPATGMMANLSTIKHDAESFLNSRYDHTYLNVNTPPFDNRPPTGELIAAHMLTQMRDLFESKQLPVEAVVWRESPGVAVVAYANGTTERAVTFSFCAGRRTYAPQLSESENSALFGIASRPGGHGHSYHLTLVISAAVDAVTGLMTEQESIDAAIREVMDEYDHRNLNTDVKALRGMPVTTEQLTRIIFEQLKRHLPLVRVRLEEYPWFAVDYTGGDPMQLVVNGAFSAAHRLYISTIDEALNRAIFGKCTNPAGHGHRYEIDLSLNGAFDPISGTILHLGRTRKQFDDELAYYHMTHLDNDIPEFAARPSTGEHIVQTLWDRLGRIHKLPVAQLHLSETPNNRFSIGSGVLRYA